MIVNDVAKPADAAKPQTGPTTGPKPGDPDPYYRLHVFCCVNERAAGHPRGCCKERGAETLRNYVKARAKQLGHDDVRINQSGCLDRCELGPTMVIYPDGVWYHYETKEDADEIIERHIGKGERVERLMLKPQDGPAGKG
ncbi:MAG: (2Fe-2S) ferredoxin domain-containing protein [Rhodospirillaceae bacterium]|nr:(2Fe-2S) ferredoxin domain-containing protein [Rhodospirillaceae bacterium]